jgi:hypothetical protein
MRKSWVESTSTRPMALLRTGRVRILASRRAHGYYGAAMIASATILLRRLFTGLTLSVLLLSVLLPGCA